MGRYYTSASGEISGKFGLGVQDSDAGLRFGMTELDRDVCGVELFQDNAEEVLMEINSIFNKMDVPQEDRRVDFSKEEDFVKAINDWSKKINLWEYAVEDIPESEFRVGKDGIKYSSDKKGYVGRAKDIRMLADYYDLLLGLEIYNDILRNGECSLYCGF